MAPFQRRYFRFRRRKMPREGTCFELRRTIEMSCVLSAITQHEQPIRFWRARQSHCLHPGFRALPIHATLELGPARHPDWVQWADILVEFKQPQKMPDEFLFALLIAQSAFQGLVHRSGTLEIAQTETQFRNPTFHRGV